jgi:hypothetical protein
MQVVVASGMRDLRETKLKLLTGKASRLVVGHQALGNQRAVGCANTHPSCLERICHVAIVADLAS